jgi:hypothetical protein
LLWPPHLSVPPGWDVFPLAVDEDWWSRLWRLGTGSSTAPIVITKV